MRIVIAALILGYTFWNGHKLMQFSDWTPADKQYWKHIWPLYIIAGTVAADYLFS